MKMELTVPEELLPMLAKPIAEELERKGLALRSPEREKPFTVEEAAAELGLSGRTVRTEVKAGDWPTVPRTGRVLIPVWAVRVRQRGGKPMEEFARMKKKGFLEG